MNRSYCVVQSYAVAGGQSFQTFGIKCANAVFEDVSTDRKTVEEMVERLNREQLEESQLAYFIEDELDR